MTDTEREGPNRIEAMRALVGHYDRGVEMGFGMVWSVEADKLEDVVRGHLGVTLPPEERKPDGYLVRARKDGDRPTQWSFSLDNPSSAVGARGWTTEVKEVFLGPHHMFTSESEPIPPLCRCGHSRIMHDARAKCGSGWCSCVLYVPDPWPARAPATEEDPDE